MGRIIPAFVCALVFVAWSGSASAQEEEAPPPWSGKGHLAVSNKTGAVDAASITVEHDLAYRGSKVELDVQTSLGYSRTAFEAQGGPGSGETRQSTTVETYAVQASFRRHLGQAGHLVGRAGWDRDPTSGLSARVLLLAGAGWGRSGRSAVNLEASGGYLIEREEDGDVLRFPALSARGALTRGVGATGEAGLDLDLIENLERTDDLLLTARGRLSASLSEHFGLALTYTVVWDNRPNDTFFDPTGDGDLLSTPEKLRTMLSASVSVAW